MSGSTTSAPAAAPAPAQAHAHHGPSLKVYLGVWAALMVLTWVTVAVAGINLGALNIWVAMAIATVKASLVVLFFMHLAFDKPMYSIVFISSLLFVALFLGFALMDTHAYRDHVDRTYQRGWDAMKAEASKFK